MIRSIEGIVTALGENSLVVTVGGIGYQIYTPTARRQFVPGDTVFIHTHLVVRENILDLYGFLDIDELNFFELLLNVPKIGPKSALQILTQADISLLSSSIMQQDPDHLHKMSGIGKKTASNLVSYLAGKIDHIVVDSAATIASSQLSPAQIDAIDALITLGYDPKEARTYIMKESNTGDTKTLIQAVLRQIPIP